MAANAPGMRTSPHSSPVLVTLVHGTFDRDARWTNANSEICKKLSRSVGERLYLLPFRWSGNNSEKARALAVKQFIDHLATQSSYFPTSPHFLVAHSHGGNIIVQALRECEIPQARILGIVTISTPFIRYGRREVFGAISQLFWIWKIILTVACFLLTLYVLAPFLALIKIPFFSLLIIGVAVILAPLEYVFIKTYLEQARKRIELAIKARQDILLRSQENQPTLLCPLLCISTPADEVNLIFRGAYFTTLVWRVAEALGTVLAKIGKAILDSDIVANMIGFFILCLGLFCFAVIGGNATGHATSGGLARSLVFPATLLAMALSLGIPISVMWALALFGTSNVQDTLAVIIHTSMRPDGVQNIRFFTVSPIAAVHAYFARRNVHTDIMYSETVSGEIAKFVGNLSSDDGRESFDIKS